MREPQLKASLIDGLFSQGLIDEKSVIVSEMPVNGMSRRADIVLANGRLLAFEIKSNGDKIDRLEGQLAAYRKCFEGVVVICGNRHADTVLKSTDAAIGVFVVDETGHEGAIMLRKPRIRHLDPEASLQHMHVKDIHKLLRNQGSVLPSLRDRTSLEAAARELPSTVLREAAIAAIKRRYSSVYSVFVSSRRDSNTLSALPLLRRDPWNVSRTTFSADTPIELQSENLLLKAQVTPRRIHPKMSSSSSEAGVAA